MKSHEFIAAVKRAADLSSSKEAERAAVATLQTLGERLAVANLSIWPRSYRRNWPRRCR
jgi:uncharacterized protein (DUF2267 family)